MRETLDNIPSPRPRSQSCDFCDEFTGGRANTYAYRYGRQATKRAILNYSVFRILPTLGQLTQGHLLIAPLEHYCAFADLQNEQTVELERLCHHVRSILRQTYGKCVFFEHGIRTKGSGGCGIDHAHMHAVPVLADSVLNVLLRTFTGRKLKRLEEINRIIPRHSSYLFFEDSRELRYVFPVQHIPSQYLRKLIAEQIGKTDWDWRRCGFEPEIVSTIERLSPMLSGIIVERD